MCNLEKLHVCYCEKKIKYFEKLINHVYNIKLINRNLRRMIIIPTGGEISSQKKIVRDKIPSLASHITNDTGASFCEITQRNH